MSFYSFGQLERLLGGTWVVAPDERHATPEGVSIDTRTTVEGQLFVAIRGDHFDGHAYLQDAVDGNTRMLLIDQEAGVDHLRVPVLRVPDCRAALSTLAASYRQSELGDAWVIAITGSCGKTTTKSFVHAALRPTLTGSAAPRSYNNDIGVPLTILGAQPSDDYVVVEIGMNAPGEIASLAHVAQPDIGVVTTIGPAHLEGLGSIEAIRREKLSLLDHVRPCGLAVMGDDIVLECDDAERRMIRYGMKADADVRLRSCRSSRAGTSFVLHDESSWHIPLAGEHNAINAIAAIAIARELGCSDEAIAIGLANVNIPGMRFELHDIGDVCVINDAYNANPQSMRAAISTFVDVACESRRRICVLGDMRELGSHSHREHVGLLEWITAEHGDEIDQLLLIGAEMEAALDTAGLRSRTVMACGRVCDETVIECILDVVEPGDAVLLKGSRAMELERIEQRMREPAAMRAT